MNTQMAVHAGVLSVQSTQDSGLLNVCHVQEWPDTFWIYRVIHRLNVHEITMKMCIPSLAITVAFIRRLRIIDV